MTLFGKNLEIKELPPYRIQNEHCLRLGIDDESTILVTDENTYPVVRDNSFWGLGIEGIPDSLDALIAKNLRETRKPYFAMLGDIWGQGWEI